MPYSVRAIERAQRETARLHDRSALQSQPMSDLGLLLTVDEVASTLRTSRGAIYTMIERGLLPGVTRIGRRVLVRRDDLLEFLYQKRAPSPKE
jgi:excisionase family DNA binding protein